MSLVILRVVAVLALILLLWNPSSARLLPAGDQPIVLLDASLSMTGPPWQAALDSARSFAGRRAVVCASAPASRRSTPHPPPPERATSVPRSKPPRAAPARS